MPAQVTRGPQESVHLQGGQERQLIRAQQVPIVLPYDVHHDLKVGAQALPRATQTQPAPLCRPTTTPLHFEKVFLRPATQQLSLLGTKHRGKNISVGHQQLPYHRRSPQRLRGSPSLLTPSAQD